MKFGAHMSISGGLHKAFALGEQAGCDTIQIFSKNQQQWRGKPLGDAEIAQFKAEQQRTGFGPLVVHDSYLINLASPKDDLWEKSIAAFGDELERCAALGIPYLVTHPGAHTGAGEAAGLAREITALNRLLDAGVGGDVVILLETTAGQGTCLGYRFEHLAELIAGATHPERLAVCVDTCHMLAAGYDIRTPEAYTATFAEFDRVIGLGKIKAFHLNDSQKDLGSRVDRHTHIGAGCIGLEGFRAIVNDPRFQGLPMLLETPKGDDLAEDIANLARLRSLIA
ncbi:MAG TPA: deoxyribonuclease IV [Kouleothrix sp.]|jgi:deoxyribonuclease-4|nr:deoxyribonuclease IV [Kouleothrix sp.]